MNRKTALSLILISLFVANVAFAAPTLDSKAPRSSIETCVAEVSNNADYSDAGNVTHSVDSKPRSVSGYDVSIRTIVYGESGDTVIRRYVSKCSINRQDEIRYFATRQKGE